MGRSLLLFAGAVFILAGCTPKAIVEPLPAAQGTAVPLGKAVEVGPYAAEAVAIVEDSRCPQEVQCVWEGRLIVRTSFATGSRREILDMTLGQTATIQGTTIVLADALPARRPEADLPLEEYRFRYELR